MLIQGGQIIPDLNDTEIDPRTAIGTNRNGRYIYLVVVDGRQPFYSEGATFAELAGLFQKHLGAFYAMSLDGGGSSTMVVVGDNLEPVILNSPIDSYIPMRERPVANYLGVHESKLPPPLAAVVYWLAQIVFNQFRKSYEDQNRANKACTRRWGFWCDLQAFFYVSAFSQSDGVPPPAHLRVTQTVQVTSSSY